MHPGTECVAWPRGDYLRPLHQRLLLLPVSYPLTYYTTPAGWLVLLWLGSKVKVKGPDETQVKHYMDNLRQKAASHGAAACSTTPTCLSPLTDLPGAKLLSVGTASLADIKCQKPL